jgi:UDP-2,3-diacylglucosamine hydrolase
MFCGMKAIFLSDAHLKNQNSHEYQTLLYFLDSIKGKISDLFIVGDFFDFWFCSNEKIYPEFQSMIDKLLQLKDLGTNIRLFEGNHDFFLDEFFTNRGIHVFPDDAAVDLDGKKLFVSHGDTIDRTNTPYLMLRRLLRSRLFYMSQKYLPSSFLWKVSGMSSKMSKDHLARPPEGLVDIMKAFSMEKFNEGFDAVILGHCHQAHIEQPMINGRKKTFAVLGDWISYYTYLFYHRGEFTLCSFEALIV